MFKANGRIKRPTCTWNPPCEGLLHVVPSDRHWYNSLISYYVLGTSQICKAVRSHNTFTIMSVGFHCHWWNMLGKHPKIVHGHFTSHYFLPGKSSLRLVQQHDMKVHGALELWNQVFLMKVMRWVSGCMYRPPHRRRRRKFITYKTGSWVGQVDGLGPLDIKNLLLLSRIEVRPVTVRPKL